MSEETAILTPEEVKVRREKKAIEIEEKKATKEKYFNRGGRVAINYETMGRFNIPPVLYFKDFSVEDENNLLLTRQEDVLETLVAILNTLKNSDADCKVEDMLTEELFETLIGIEKQFDTTQHIHSWVCDCQNEIDEQDRKINETEIDLNTLQYKSIDDSDEILKNFYKEKFASMSDEEWKIYLFTRYKDNPIMNINEYTRSEEVIKIKIKEPFQLKIDGQMYMFRFTRVGDMIKAKKMASEKFSQKIKIVQNRKDPNIPLIGLRDQKKEEIDKLKYEEIKYMFLAMRALSLLTVNGKELTDEEKVNMYAAIPRNVQAEIRNFIDQFKIGVQHEQEFTCPLCGRSDKRLLQREIDFYELLPTAISSKRKLGKRPGVDFFVAV